MIVACPKKRTSLCPQRADSLWVFAIREKFHIFVHELFAIFASHREFLFIISEIKLRVDPFRCPGIQSNGMELLQFRVLNRACVFTSFYPARWRVYRERGIAPRAPRGYGHGCGLFSGFLSGRISMYAMFLFGTI